MRRVSNCWRAPKRSAKVRFARCTIQTLRLIHRGRWKGHVIVMDKIQWQPVENQVWEVWKKLSWISIKFHRYPTFLRIYCVCQFVSLLVNYWKCFGSPLVGFSIIVRYRAASRHPWFSLACQRDLGDWRARTCPDTQWDWCIYLHLPTKLYPNVGKYTIHWAFGLVYLSLDLPVWVPNGSVTGCQFTIP